MAVIVMTLLQLQYFQTVCRYGSVSKAAEILHISQPSVSCAIKDLEAEFRITLFHRQYRGMRLTAEGQQFFALTNHLLSGAEQTTRAMHNLSQKKQQIRVGVPPMIGSLFLPRIYTSFSVRHPEIEILLEEAGRQELQLHLSQGQLDCALLPHDGPLDTSLSCRKIAQLETVCCVSSQHTLAGMPNVRMEELSQFPLVLFKDSFFQTERIMSRFFQQDLIPNVRLYTSQLSTVSALISENAAIGFMFRQLADPISGLVSIPLEPPMQVQVSLVWRKYSLLSGELQKFSEHISNIFPTAQTETP